MVLIYNKSRYSFVFIQTKIILLKIIRSQYRRYSIMRIVYVQTSKQMLCIHYFNYCFTETQFILMFDYRVGETWNAWPNIPELVFCQLFVMKLIYRSHKLMMLRSKWIYKMFYCFQLNLFVCFLNLITIIIGVIFNSANGEKDVNWFAGLVD